MESNESLNYEIELRYRARANEDFLDRHTGFIEEVKYIDPPWGIKDYQSALTLPEIGDHLSVERDLSSFFGNGISCRAAYVLRNENYLRDDAEFDDHCFFTFNAELVDYEYLVTEVFPTYLKAYTPYRATIQNYEIATTDWDTIAKICEVSGKDVNGRDGVYRINAANYFDAELCFRAFRLTPERVVEKLNGKVEKVEVFQGGVLIIYTSRYLEPQELLTIDDKIKGWLGIGKPTFLQKIFRLPN